MKKNNAPIIADKRPPGITNGFLFVDNSDITYLEDCLKKPLTQEIRGYLRDALITHDSLELYVNSLGEITLRVAWISGIKNLLEYDTPSRRSVHLAKKDLEPLIQEIMSEAYKRIVDDDVPDEIWLRAWRDVLGEGRGSGPEPIVDAIQRHLRQHLYYYVDADAREGTKLVPPNYGFSDHTPYLNREDARKLTNLRKQRYDMMMDLAEKRIMILLDKKVDVPRTDFETRLFRWWQRKHPDKPIMAKNTAANPFAYYFSSNAKHSAAVGDEMTWCYKEIRQRFLPAGIVKS